MPKFLIVCFVILMLIVVPFVGAQDESEPTAESTVEPTEEATAEPTPNDSGEPVPDEEPTRVDHESVADMLYNTFAALVMAAFGGTPIVVTVTALLKRLKVFDFVTSKDISFGVASVLYILAIAASYAELSPQFYSLLDTVVIVIPAIMAFITTLGTSPALYHVFKGLGVPVLGEPRG